MPKLEEVLRDQPVTVTPDAGLRDAAERMLEAHAGAACVVDGDDRLVGILTERDVLRAVAGGVDLADATVAAWMTAEPVVSHSSDEAAAALQVMIDRGFRHLPVLRDGTLAGVVSMRHLSIVLQSARMG